MPRIQQVSRLKQIPGIGVDRVGDAADAAADPAFLRLENLDVDIPPLATAIAATQAAISQDDNNSYLPFLGQNALRQIATEHVSRLSGVQYDWRSQCVISAGGLSGVLNCLLATLEPGDEVVLVDPIYAGLINRIRLAGGVPRFVPLIPAPEGWRLDLEKLKSAISPRTRVVIMMSPSMPTGHVLNQTEWQAVADVCIKTDAWLLYDAAMERILFDDHVVNHPASLPGMAERTITVGAASKELRMIGWRVGWVVGPQAIMKDVGLVSLCNVVCQVGIAMPGVAAALAAGDADVVAAARLLEGRRNVLLREMQGLPVIPPAGGWSLMLDTEALGFASADAASLLFNKAKIAATPMVGWGDTASRYLRFVFSNEPEERLQGMGRKLRAALGLGG